MLSFDKLREVWEHKLEEAGFGGLRCNECEGRSRDRTYYPDPSDIARLLCMDCYTAVIKRLTR